MSDISLHVTKGADFAYAMVGRDADVDGVREMFVAVAEGLRDRGYTVEATVATTTQTPLEEQR